MDQNLRTFGAVPRVLRIYCGGAVLGLFLTSSANAGEIREERVTFEGVVFRVVQQDPAQVRLELNGSGKTPMRTFGRVQAKMSKLEGETTFLMNGGICEPGGIPTGMHIEDSVNLKHRNGVGVNAEGQLVFAMTDKNEETNFHKFARLFRDKLGCPDALFLDGDISQMVVNPDGPVESNRFGAIFVGVEKAGE